MIDTVKQEPLRVSGGGEGWPYLVVPLSQLDRVRELFDRHGVTYWTDSFSISIDRKPHVIYVNFGRSADVGRLQQILDESQ